MISPAQCRAARALLDLSQAGLAELAGTGALTIRQFERGQTVPHRATMAAIVRAFEGLNVTFDRGPESFSVTLRRTTGGGI